MDGQTDEQMEKWPNEQMNKQAGPSSDQLRTSFVGLAYICCYCSQIMLIDSGWWNQVEKIGFDKVNSNKVEQIKLKNHMD